MGYLIDTSVLIGIERSGAAPETLLNAIGDDPAFLAAISASELLHGVHRADSPTRRERRERFVEGAFEVLPVLAFDLGIARVHSRLWAELSRQGMRIGHHDAEIAATALFHDLTVVTHNVREFGRVEGLNVEMWDL